MYIVPFTSKMPVFIWEFSRLTYEFGNSLNNGEWEDDEGQPWGQEANTHVYQELEVVEDGATPLDQGQGA